MIAGFAICGLANPCGYAFETTADTGCAAEEGKLSSH